MNSSHQIAEENDYPLTSEFFLSRNATFNDAQVKVDVRHGVVVELCCLQGDAICTQDVVMLSSGASAIIRLKIAHSAAQYGCNAPIVFWRDAENSFAFLPHDIPLKNSISVANFGICIARDFERLKNRLQPDDTECSNCPEPSWDAWADNNNQARVPTVLGISRDQRLFIVDPEADLIKATIDLNVPVVNYDFARPGTADVRYKRKLVDGWKPMLEVTQNVGELEIHDVIFVSFIDRCLTESNLVGTPVDIAHFFSVLSTFPDGIKEQVADSIASYEAVGEIGLFIRTEITNKGDVPLLAAQRLPRARQLGEKDANGRVEVRQLTGRSKLDEHGVVWTEGIPFGKHLVDGEIPCTMQPSKLLFPGQQIVVESVLSHSGSGLGEASRRKALHWSQSRMEVDNFWEKKLQSVAKISVPEQRLNDLWKAGLVHLELVTFGKNHSGPLLPKVGIYSAIGSESIPIIEFFHSLGKNQTAERSLDFFFSLQHESGRINVYAEYDVETGAALFLAGLHFRYSNSLEWVRSNAGSLKKAAEYLISLRQWKNESSREYGLVLGTCADPVEQTAAYMLNAYNVAGLRAVAQMLHAVGDVDHQRYYDQAEDYATRLMAAVARSFQEGPILPSDGTRWVPSCSPQVNGNGPQMWGLNGEDCFTHWTYSAFDSLLGPLYLVYLGVIDYHHPSVEWLLEVNERHFSRAYVSESQPYYSRHPEIHLLRGERTKFLNAFYSALTSLADRETFTFWEHYHKVSPHKTHEEGWALMQLRRMLWLEDNKELRLLAGIPQSWLAKGQVVKVTDGVCYFGVFSLSMSRSSDGKMLSIDWRPDFHAPPVQVMIFVGNLCVDLRDASHLMQQSGEWLKFLCSQQAFSGELEILPRVE